MASLVHDCDAPEAVTLVIFGVSSPSGFEACAVAADRLQRRRVDVIGERVVGRADFEAAVAFGVVFLQAADADRLRVDGDVGVARFHHRVRVAVPLRFEVEARGHVLPLGEHLAVELSHGSIGRRTTIRVLNG